MSNFLKNTAISSVSTVAAQLIPLLFSTVITRLYVPEVYGEFSTFLAFVTVLVGVSMWRFDFSLFVAKSEGERKGLLSLSFFILLMTVLLISIVLFLIRFLFVQDLPGIYFLLPLLVLMASITQLFNQVLIINNQFMANGKRKVFQSFSFNSSAVGVGFIYPASISLAIGQLFSHLVVFIYSIWKTRAMTEIRIIFDLNIFRDLFRKYISFPKSGLMSAFFNTLGSQSSLFIIPAFYGLGVAGLYALTVKLLYLPIQLVGKAISDSLFQQLSENKLRSHYLFRKISFSLFALGFLPFTILFFFGETLFNFVFGSAWIESGNFAKILAPFFLIRFVVAPQISFFTAFSRLDLELRFNTLFMISQIGSLVLPVVFGGTIYDGLTLMAVSGIACYIYAGILIHNLVRHRR